MQDSESNKHSLSVAVSGATKRGKPVNETDVVIWYTLGSHHPPRPEDWPVMPVSYASFLLQPVGFFPANPALDVPPSKARANGQCCS